MISEIASPKKNKSEITPISDDYALKIEAMPLLSMLLPYKFGTNQIELVETTCASCGKNLLPAEIHGEFTVLVEGQAVSLESYGVCYTCKTITPTIAKFRDDGSALVKVGTNWVQDKWCTGPKTSKKAKFIAFLLVDWQKTVPPSIAAAIVVGYYVYNKIHLF